MTKCIHLRRTALGVGLLCGACAPLAAEFLPIVNPSFEQLSRPLTAGEQTNGAGGVGVFVGTRYYTSSSVSYDNPVEVPGWRTYLTPGARIYAGVLNPPLLGVPPQPFMTGHDGTYIASVQVAALQQTIDHTLRANTRYRLSFLAGIGRFGTANGVYISLVAAPDLQTVAIDGQPNIITLIRSQGLLPPRESFGTMLPYTLEYTTPSVLPPTLQGRYIAISFTGGDGIPRTCFDDFRLEAIPVGVRCDLNCDGNVNFDDIEGFVLALVSETAYAAAYPVCDRRLADADQDGDVSFDDIEPFVTCLIAGP